MLIFEILRVRNIEACNAGPAPQVVTMHSRHASTSPFRVSCAWSTSARNSITVARRSLSKESKTARDAGEGERGLSRKVKFVAPVARPVAVHPDPQLQTAVYNHPKGTLFTHKSTQFGYDRRLQQPPARRSSARARRSKTQPIQNGSLRRDISMLLCPGLNMGPLGCF